MAFPDYRDTHPGAVKGASLHVIDEEGNDAWVWLWPQEALELGQYLLLVAAQGHKEQEGGS
jgi:hypothetical protein